MIQWFNPHLWGNEKKYVLDALDSNWISDGDYIKKFEASFAQHIKTKEVISVSSGTAALHLALLILGIGRGDEVIVPGYTFSAPANMVMAVGATPVFADVDPDTWCLSETALTSKITKKTKAVIPVHLYGNICAMKKIMELSKAQGIAVIEDVAEAAFSKYADQHAGTFGEVGCFSFQATKTITMGEGGALITSDPKLAEKARLIRNHGMRPENRYWHEEVGHNFRLTNMQAALGYAQLERLEEILGNKRRVYKAYQERLSGSRGITFQRFEKEVDPIIWSVAIKIDPKFFIGDREKIIFELKERGIEARKGFWSFNRMPLYNAGDLPFSDDVSQNIINLPSSSTLMEEEIDYICHQLNDLRT